MINQLLWSPTPVTGTKNRCNAQWAMLFTWVTPDGGLRKGPRRPGWDGGLSAFMRAVIASERGGALYKLRAKLVEPVSGNTKLNRHIGSTARDRAACWTEWRLITATHNLMKVHKHPLAGATA